MISHNELSVLSMAVMGFKQNLDRGWVGGWGELYPFFWILFNFAKPLNNLKKIQLKQINSKQLRPIFSTDNMAAELDL